MLLVLCAAMGMALPVPPPAAQTSQAKKKAGSAKHKTSSRHRRAKKTSWKRKGQQGIQSERAAQIQEALIREHYLTGDPTGVWDARTQTAMAKYQEDNGWQNKVTPDSRALIKLGLGPNYSSESLLNPEGRPSEGRPPDTKPATAAPISARAAGVPASSGANQDK
jgi:peptidoglycan hydrolase-like protein with peptidoglycan-binding domain